MKTDTIMSQLQKKGFRTTKIRQAIIDHFSTCDDLHSAKDIQERLHRNGLTANKTTIYREIEFFKKQHVLQEIEFGDGKKRYERASEDHHHHIVCLRCDQVEHVVLSDAIGAEEKKIARETNFKITHHLLEFFGLCHQCQEI